MIKERKVILGLFLISIFHWPLVYGQVESPTLAEKSVVSAEGRLAVEKHGKEEWLVLHAKDAQTYLVKGNCVEKLKTSLLELRENNLVSVAGNQDGRSNVSCEQSYKYETKEKSTRELKVSIKCIRYNHLEVTQILWAKKSAEEIPPPKRDIEEERRLTRTLKQQPLISPIVGEIYGKITSLNFKSAVKTVKVANQDKDSPLENVILIITPDTRIVKKVGEEEPMALRIEALKVGQKVTAMYSKDELKAEALFITITKE